MNIKKKKLGLEGFSIFDLKQIHLIDDVAMPKNTWGYLDDENFNIFIRASLKKEILEKTLLHEMLHLSSKIKVIFDNLNKYSQDNDLFSGIPSLSFEDPQILENRIGYDLGYKLIAFNEVITEKIIDEIWEKYLGKHINDRSELYQFWKDALEIILDRVSQNDKIKRQEI